jgi:hypothetical protein
MSCPRTFCPGCDEEMIHRDNRRHYESASGLGQIISRDGPRTFTVGDIDLYLWKDLLGRELIRLLEHKQPGQPLKAMQQKVLRRLEALIAHAIDCERSPIRLDQTSGVYVLRGLILAQPDGRRKTELGAQRVWNPRSGWFDLPSQRAVFRWLDGQPLAEVAA